MRINDTNYGYISYQKQQNRSNIANPAKKTSTSAEVTISARGKEMSEAMMAEQTQRQMRVQELKQKIADGSYHVDSSKIADKMLGFWKNESI